MPILEATFVSSNLPPQPASAVSPIRENRRHSRGLGRRSSVGNHDAQKDAAPSPSSRSPMQAGSGPAARCPPAAQRFRWPPNAARRRPTLPFGRSGPNSRTSLAGASRSCAALILVRRASTTARWSVPFASMEKAAGMCRTLKAAGGNCLIQRN